MSNTAEVASRQPPAFVTKLATFALRSPLHGMFSKNLLLITFKGRKSGNLFTIPIGYQREGNTVTCFTDHRWWKNLVANPDVVIYLKGKAVQARAEIINDDKETINREITQYILNRPMAARAFGVTLDEQKRPVPESLQQVVPDLTLIRLHLQ